MSPAATRRRLVSRGDLPGSDGGIYNPGAVLAGPSILLLCRREIDYRFTSEVYPERILVDPTTLAIIDHRTLGRDAYPPDSRIEDFRCLLFEGMLLVVHNLVGRGRIKPVISRVVGDRLEPFDDFALPIALEPVEKNWVLFEKNGSLYCLYKLDPLTIFVRTSHRSWKLVKQNEESGWAAQFDKTLSNSTNLIPFHDGYLGFWHTILENRYVQGAYVVGSDLEIAHRTGILLDGAEIREGFKPGVLYVSSLVQHRDRILAFYGEADAHTGVAVFDSAELWQALLRSPFRITPPVRVRYDGTSTGDLFRAMQAVGALSAQRGRSRIRLSVADLRLRPLIDLFKIPNLTVQEHGRGGDDDYRLDGTSPRAVPIDPRATPPIGSGAPASGPDPDEAATPPGSAAGGGPAPSPLAAVSMDAFDAFAVVRDRSAIDVGANKGAFTESFLLKGSSRVVAIEPGPRLAAGLRCRFGADPRVIVRQEGLSDRNGTLTGVKFHNCWTLARPGEFTNRLRDVSPGAEAYEGNGVFDVRLTTLDAVVDEHGLSDLAFIKIDVDGYEARVLRGGERTLTTLRPAVMLELSYLVHDLGDPVPEFIRHIYALGYTVVTMKGQVASARQVLDHFPWHTSFDVMMLPQEMARLAGLPRLV